MNRVITFTGTNNILTELYYLQGPPTGVAHDVVVSATGSAQFIESFAQGFQGAEVNKHPIGATNSVELGAPASPTINLTTTVAGSMVIDQWWEGTASSMTAGAGQTVIQNHGTIFGGDWVGSSYEPAATVGTYTMSWTGGTFEPQGVVLELLADSGAVDQSGPSRVVYPVRLRSY
jgi:hypothetical protein